MSSVEEEGVTQRGITGSGSPWRFHSWRLPASVDLGWGLKFYISKKLLRAALQWQSVSKQAPTRSAPSFLIPVILYGSHALQLDYLTLHSTGIALFEVTIGSHITKFSLWENWSLFLNIFLDLASGTPNVLFFSVFLLATYPWLKV